MPFRHQHSRRIPRGLRPWLTWSTVALALATISVAFTGLGGWEALSGRSSDSVTDILFKSVALLFLDQPVTSRPPNPGWFAAARVLAIAFFMSAGAAVTLLWAVTAEGWERVRLRRIGKHSSRSASRSHVVVMGLGSIGAQVVRDLRRPVEKRHGAPDAEPTASSVIVIERDGSNPAVDVAREKGAIVLVGDAGEAAIRRRARLDCAREVIIACGDERLNIEIAGRVVEDFRSRAVSRHSWETAGPKSLNCHVHVGDPSFLEVLRKHHAAPGSLPIDVSVFNTFENAARDLLIDEDHGLATNYAPSEEHVPYYVIFGFGLMGQTAALRIARLAHFPGQHRPQMTICDKRIEAARDYFLAVYPGFAPAGGVDLEKHAGLADPAKDTWGYRGYRVPPAWQVPPADVPDSDLDQYYGSRDRADVARNAVEYVVNAEFLDLQGAAHNPEVVSRLLRRFKRTGDPGGARPEADPWQSYVVKPAIIVCFLDERRNLETAFALRERLSSQGPETLPGPLPLYVYLPSEEGASTLLKGAGADPRFPIHVFGRTADVSRYREISRPVLDRLARSINLSYHSHSEGGDLVDPESRSAEEADRLWRTLAPWERAANAEAAEHVVIKLSSVGRRFQLAADTAGRGDESPATRKLESLGPVEHNRWMAEKLLAGWRCEPYPADYASLHETDGERNKKTVRNEEMAPRLRRASLVPWGEHLWEEDKNKDGKQLKHLLWALEHAG